MFNEYSSIVSKHTSHIWICSTLRLRYFSWVFNSEATNILEIYFVARWYYHPGWRMRGYQRSWGLCFEWRVGNRKWRRAQVSSSSSSSSINSLFKCNFSRICRLRRALLKYSRSFSLLKHLSFCFFLFLNLQLRQNPTKYQSSTFDYFKFQEVKPCRKAFWL